MADQAPYSTGEVIAAIRSLAEKILVHCPDAQSYAAYMPSSIRDLLPIGEVVLQDGRRLPFVIDDVLPESDIMIESRELKETE